MSWSDRVMAALDERATVVETARGAVQFGRSGEGPQVLALHGGPGGFDQGLAAAWHLEAGGCEVLAPSRPGYLRTPIASGGSPAEQADLYAALLDELQIERVAVLGYSSGGPSAVQFAARHPERTRALFLDAAVLKPFHVPLSAVKRAVYENGMVVWASYQFSSRWPRRLTSMMVNGMSTGLSKEQRRAAVEWINSDPVRVRSMQAQWASIAPRRYRKDGWANDQANEALVGSLPFAEISAPTVVAHGVNDGVIAVETAIEAASEIAGAELMLVEEGHHAVSLNRNYGVVAARQLELVREG